MTSTVRIQGKSSTGDARLALARGGREAYRHPRSLVTAVSEDVEAGRRGAWQPPDLWPCLQVRGPALHGSQEPSVDLTSLALFSVIWFPA